MIFRRLIHITLPEREELLTLLQHHFGEHREETFSELLELSAQTVTDLQFVHAYILVRARLFEATTKQEFAFLTALHLREHEVREVWFTSWNASKA